MYRQTLYVAYTYKHNHYKVIEKHFRGKAKMNASTIISDEMSLDEKLAAIDAAMANAQAQASDDAQQNGSTNYAAPLDPADLTMCLGCQ